LAHRVLFPERRASLIFLVSSHLHIYIFFLMISSSKSYLVTWHEKPSNLSRLK